MSIIDTYKPDFKIITYDEDPVRGEEIHEVLKSGNYNHRVFSSGDLLYESLKKELPHILLLHYQPLNIKFHEMIQKLRDMSHEVEIVVLAGCEFWPGIHNLLKSASVNDFWSWPPGDEQILSLRLNQLIEKMIFKFIAEQRSEETSLIVNGLEDLRQRQTKLHKGSAHSNRIPFDLNGSKEITETELINQFIGILKKEAFKSEFVYLRNYPARSQLLVMGTSFSTEKHFRGHRVSFSLEDFNGNREETLKKLNQNLKDLFFWEDFVLQPVEFAGDFYGLLVAFHFDSTDFLKKMARYLSVHLRNIRLEKSGTPLETDNPSGPLHLDPSPGAQTSGTTEDPKSPLPQDSKKLSDKTSAKPPSRGDSHTPAIKDYEKFKKTLSSEISRSRLLGSPLSLVICHLHFLSDQNQTREKNLELIKTQLHGYDTISRLDQHKIALILPHCSFKTAAAKAEKIRRQLVTWNLETKNPALRLCFGVSEFPGLSTDSEVLFSHAKKACLRVLNSGKNKICLYLPDRGFQSELQS